MSHINDDWSTVTTQEQIVFEQLKSIVLGMRDVVSLIDGANITPNAWLVDLDLDSILRIEILMLIEQTLNVEIGFYEIDETATWMDLTRLVLSRQTSSTAVA